MAFIGLIPLVLGVLAFLASIAMFIGFCLFITGITGILMHIIYVKQGSAKIGKAKVMFFSLPTILGIGIMLWPIVATILAFIE